MIQKRSVGWEGGRAGSVLFLVTVVAKHVCFNIHSISYIYIYSVCVCVYINTFLHLLYFTVIVSRSVVSDSLGPRGL